MANFGAFEGYLTPLGAMAHAALSEVCSIFYSPIV